MMADPAMEIQLPEQSEEAMEKVERLREKNGGWNREELHDFFREFGNWLDRRDYNELVGTRQVLLRKLSSAKGSPVQREDDSVVRLRHPG